MKTFLIGLALVFYSLSSYAQFDTLEVKKNINASVDSMLILFGEKNWDKYADFMNPRVIAMVGGREVFAEVLKSQMKMLDSATFDEVNKGRILQVVKQGKQYQCIVESFMQMRLMGMMVSGSSYDLGVSADGVKWNFTRIAEGGYNTIKQIIPDLNPLLKLPKSQMIPGMSLEEFKKNYQVSYYHNPTEKQNSVSPKPKAVINGKPN